MRKTRKIDTPPAQMVCNISGKLIHDPWIDNFGYRYEGATILEWIKRYGVSPVTGEPMTRNDVSPEPSLKILIEKWKETHSHQDSDSTRKKLMKLVKSSFKSRGSSEVSSNVPDYDAIIRLRARQDTMKLQNPDDAGIKSRAAHIDNMFTNALSGTDVGTPISPGYISESIVSDANGEDKKVRAEKRQKTSSSKGPSKKSKAGLDGTLSEVSSVKSASKSIRSQPSASSQVNTGVRPKPSRGISFGSPADGPDTFQTLESVSHVGGGIGDEFSENDDGDDWVAGEPMSGWYKLQRWCSCGVWNPLQSCYEIFFRDHTIRPALGDLAYAPDCILCLGMLWLLNDTILGVCALRLEGFQDWLESDASTLVRFIFSSYNASAWSVLFVVIGYYLPAMVFNTVQVDASKQTRFNMFTTYVKGMFPIIVEGYLKLAPIVWITVLFVMTVGTVCSDDSILRYEYLVTCSSSQAWWTNFAFVTNFSALWTSENRDKVLDISTTFDSGSNLMELEYADLGTCFPSMWAVSCVVQLLIIFLPLVYMYLEYPTAAISGTSCIIITALLARTYISSTVTSPYQFAGLIYYSPWGRADAFALGLRLFMQSHYKFVSPTESRRHANKSLGLMQLTLWSFFGLVPREVSLREFQYRRKRRGYQSDPDSISETASLLGKVNKKVSKKKKKIRSDPLSLDDLPLGRGGNAHQRGNADEGISSGSDDLDDTKSIFSQITAESYKFPSSISYMARAYDDVDFGDDNFTDIDRSTVYSDTGPRMSPLWQTCLKFIETSAYLLIFCFCCWWVVFSSTGSTGSESKPSWFIFSDYQYRNVTQFITAVGAYLLAMIGIRGDAVPISVVMCWDGWHPLASLATCLYLVQNMTVNLLCTLLFSWVGNEWSVASNSQARGEYVVLYLEVLLANLMVALLFAVFVERPLNSLASKFSIYSTLDRI